jgi:hypothetical protein
LSTTSSYQSAKPVFSVARRIALSSALILGGSLLAVPVLAAASPSSSPSASQDNQSDRSERDDIGSLLGNPRGLAPTQVHTTGYYRGHRVEYLDLGVVHLAPGNDVDPIWVVTNGTADQRNIIDTVPGDPAGYTPLWQVTKITWNPGVKARTLTSRKAVERALAKGWITIETTDIIVNCPVLGFNQAVTHGYLKGNRVDYYDLGPLKLAPGNDIDPIWVVTNGTASQANIIDNAPPASDYTPLWGVVKVTWNAGVTPRTLTSATAVDSAVAAGQATLMTTDIVVNCPVI